MIKTIISAIIIQITKPNNNQSKHRKEFTANLSFCLILAVTAVLSSCSLPEPCDILNGMLLLDSGECISCDINGYHRQTVGDSIFCVEDTIKACGYSETDCTTEGTSEVGCINGKCQIIRCDESHSRESRSDGTEYCMPTTTTECGDSKTNCLELQGVTKAECINGKCQILSCADDYTLDSNGCYPNAIYHCGDNDNNCLNEMDTLYHHELSRQVASPSCVEGQCEILCRDYTDGEGIEHNTSMLTCESYQIYKEEFESKYGNNFMAICNDESNKDLKFCLPHLCPKPKAGETAKITPGLCGCGVYEDTEDTDRDGVINCNDACPNNPTKWDKEIWWNSQTNEEIRCDVYDTDRDGVDDEEDGCPTNPNITETTYCGLTEYTFDNDDVNLIKNHCSKAYKVLKQLASMIPNLKCSKKMLNTSDYEMLYDAIYNDEQCINYLNTSNEDNDIDEFVDKLITNSTKDMCENFKTYYIYNANDFKNIQTKMQSLYKKNRCSDNTNFCSNDYLEVCYTNSLPGRYKCDECVEEEETVTCENMQWQPYITIKLMNDINLDDIHNTLLTNTEQCLNYQWESLINILGIKLDGQGHTIYFKRENVINNQQSIRCYITNVLCDKVSFSEITNLNFDLDMYGSAHALLANELDSVSLKNVKILRSKIHPYNITENIGVLSGSYKKSYSFDDVFNNVELHNIVVEAPNSNSVGGMFGTMDVDRFNCNQFVGDNISVTGYNYVGGVVGNHSSFKCDMIEMNEINVSGNNNVGGIAGWNAYSWDSVTATLHIRTVNGYDNVGGIFGVAQLGIRNSNIESHVENVSGNDYVGGFIGQLNYFYEIHNSTLINQINTISGHSYIGGFTGQLKAFNLDGTSNSVLIYNIIDNISAEENYVGGFAGQIFFNPKKFQNIFNHINSVSGQEHVSGFTNCTSAPSSLFNSIFNNVSTIKGKDHVAAFLTSDYSISIQNIDSQVEQILSDNDNPVFIEGVSSNNLNNIYSKIGSTIYTVPEELTLDELHQNMCTVDETILKSLKLN